MIIGSDLEIVGGVENSQVEVINIPYKMVKKFQNCNHFGSGRAIRMELYSSFVWFEEIGEIWFRFGYSCYI